MATQQEVIQNFMKSLDNSKVSGEEALDNAVKKASSYFKSFQTVKSNSLNIKDAFINDLKSTKDVEYFLRVYCGIDFSTEDSGAITGFDAGGKQIKNDADSVPEIGGLNTYFKSSSFSVNGLNVELADSKIFGNLTDSEKFIWQGLYTWWMENALNLIADSYGENFSFDPKKAKPSTNKMYVEFINDANADKIAIADPMDDDNPTYNETTGEITSLKLIINMYYYNDLKDDLEKANSEFDRDLTHELTHAVMMANILYLPVYRSLPGFITEGLAELTIGITNSNKDSIKALAADVSKFELGIDANNLARDESFMYEGGYIFLRYLARQFGDLTIANDTKNTLLLTFYGADTIENSAGNVTISSGENNDSIKSSGSKVRIDAAGGKDTIYVSQNAKSNAIDCGAGNDFVSVSSNSSKTTIIGGAGNDTIYNGSETALITGDDGKDFIYLYLDAKNNSASGGKGDDTIISGADKALINGDDGNDYITLYGTAKNNTVNGGSGSNYIYVYKDSANHTITGEKGSDTVHSEGTDILIETGEGKDLIQLFAKDSTTEKNTVDSGIGDDSIYSGGATISVNAGEGDDYIHIYTNATNNTINAGKGNDSIDNECINGVVFQYAAGDGNDSIKGFTAKDTLSISGGDYSIQSSDNDIIVNVGSNKITLDGAATLTSFNIGTLSGGSATLNVTNSMNSPVTVGSSVKVIDASKRTTNVKITGNKLANTIQGGSKKDSLYGGKGNDKIYGNAGNDKLYGQAGADTLWGGAGNDTLKGGDGDDVFIYSAGKDVITDYTSGDKISLGAAISKSTVSGSDVILTIGSGSLTVKEGKNRILNMITSAGKNLSTVVGATTLKVTDSTKSPVTAKSSGALVDLPRIIDASKRTKAVKITGNGLDNSIKGGSGKDTLWGGAANDTLIGGKGKDVFIYSEGRDIITDYATGDRISLGAEVSKSSIKGSDVIFTIGSGSLTVKNAKGKSLSMINSSGKSFSTILSGETLFTVTDETSSPVTVNSEIKTINASTRTTAVKITGNDNANTISGGKGKDSLYGGDGNDSIVGNAGNDKIYGQNGNDKLYGNDGNDTLSGGDGNDSLVGGAGKDKLYGQSGNDTLWGGAGNDSLWGADGADTFIYASGDGQDVIYGFDYTDMLQITGEFTTSYDKSKKEIYFKVGSTTDAITLKEFTASTFNVNGTAYTISGKKLVPSS